MNYVILNSELMKEGEACISPQDRGFRYGDGIFDTLIVSNGRLYQFDWHMERIKKSLNAIYISFDTGILQTLCTKLLSANHFKNGLLRIQITRGIGGRGYLPETSAHPTLVIETMEQPKMDKYSISLWQSRYKKIALDALPVQSKLCQGLNSTLARIEANEQGCFDALLLNERNQICETSSANVFWLKNEELYTPSLDCGVLEGSIRAAIVRLWTGKLNEVKASLESLKTADAVFVTNVAWKALEVSEFKTPHTHLKWKKGNNTIHRISKLLENDVEMT